MAGQEILAGEADCQDDEDDEDDGVCYVLEKEGKGAHKEIEGEKDISHGIMGEIVIEQDMVDMGAVGVKWGFVSQNSKGKHTKRIEERQGQYSH